MTALSRHHQFTAGPSLAYRVASQFVARYRMTIVENEILNRWASGQSGGTIRRAMNLSRNKVTEVVCAARARGDFRAIHHAAPDGQIIGRYRHRPSAQMDRVI